MRLLALLLVMLSAMWLAGDVILGAVAAKGVFVHASPSAEMLSRDEAGAVFGGILGRWYAVVMASFFPLVLFLGTSVSGLLLYERRYVPLAGSIMLLVGILSVHLWSAAVLTEAIAVAPPLTASVTYSAEEREWFNVLHHRSTTLFTCEALLLLAAMIGSGLLILRTPVAENQTDRVACVT